MFLYLTRVIPVFNHFTVLFSFKSFFNLSLDFVSLLNPGIHPLFFPHSFTSHHFTSPNFGVWAMMAQSEHWSLNMSRGSAQSSVARRSRSFHILLRGALGGGSHCARSTPSFTHGDLLDAISHQIWIWHSSVGWSGKLGAIVNLGNLCVVQWNCKIVVISH